MKSALYLLANLLCVGSLGCRGAKPAIAPNREVSPTAAFSLAEGKNLALPDETHLRNIRQLTRGQGENAEAYWSFRGDELTFQSTRPPYQCDQIFRINAQSGVTKQVSSGKGRTTCSYFFPNEDRILFASTHELGVQCPPKADMSKGYAWALYDYDIFSTDGKTALPLISGPGYDAEATVCGKDGSIVFTSTRDGDLELYRADSAGKNIKRLTHTPGYDGGAFFSADCSQIVWRASRPQGKALDDYYSLLREKLVRPSQLDLWVANADGSEARQVTYLDAGTFAPFFHPDGKRILFASNYPNPRGREFDIYMVNIDGTGLERVTTAPGFDSFPMFSPDGKQLVFSSNRNQKNPGETDVYVAEWSEQSNPKNFIAHDVVSHAQTLGKDVAWLADDARQGRGPGTDGLVKSAEYIEKSFISSGLQPVFKGSFRQDFDLALRISVGPASALSIDKLPVAANNFVPLGFSALGKVSASAVSVGFGIELPARKINDYRGKNLKGKIAIIERFLPEVLEKDSTLPSAEKRRLSDMRYKAFVAKQKGAVGVLFFSRSDRGDELPKITLATEAQMDIPVMIVNGPLLANLSKAKQVSMAVDLNTEKTRVSNIMGVIAGKDRGAAPLVIGAHYDHLGLGGKGSLAPESHEPHNGADDNASGTAALLDLASKLKPGLLPRDVILIAFSGEESGTIGSQFAVKNWSGPKPMAMLNLDMVGRLRNNAMEISGGSTASEWLGLVQPLCDAARLQCKIDGDGFGPSDHRSFYAADIPVLFFSTGPHSDYHTPSDDVGKVNLAGLAKISDLVAKLVPVIAKAPRLTLNKTADSTVVGDTKRGGASLGTIPDYSFSGTGVKLIGVRTGGPADKAGVLAGDILVKVGEYEIASVQDLMYVLTSALPNKEVELVVVRDGKRISCQATFGISRMR